MMYVSIRPLQLLAILLCATLAGCGPHPRPPENTYANKTEAAVRSELGDPDREFAGHYAAPPPDFTQKFSGEIKTLVFKKGGYEHYVSFEKRPTGWISICSSSVPEGAVF
jgi:hypothetical protein